MKAPDYLYEISYATTTKTISSSMGTRSVTYFIAVAVPWLGGMRSLDLNAPAIVWDDPTSRLSPISRFSAVSRVGAREARDRFADAIKEGYVESAVVPEHVMRHLEIEVHKLIQEIWPLEDFKWSRSGRMVVYKTQGSLAFRSPEFDHGGW